MNELTKKLNSIKTFFFEHGEAEFTQLLGHEKHVIYTHFATDDSYPFIHYVYDKHVTPTRLNVKKRLVETHAKSQDEAWEMFHKAVLDLKNNKKIN